MVGDNFQVLVIGAGPTGLTMANILGMYGIRTLLVERNAATVAEPRAVSIDDESLRTMQFIGLIDTVRKSIVEGYGSHYFSPSGRCFTKVLPDIVEYGYVRRSAFRQPVLEAQLREGLGRFAHVETRFSTRVTMLEETGGEVRATLVGPDGTEDTVSAEYVAACDGGRSATREALGIGMVGSSYDQGWLIIDLAGSSQRFRHTQVFCDPTRPGLSLPGPDGTKRYEFMMLPGEKPEELLDEANVRKLLARHSEEDPNLQIVRKVIYHFHARIAERWRSGRIFLAGDAAHLTPPFAGQGMNSGVRDAQNLGWKLAACLRGELGSKALDSFETERRPHAWALIQLAVIMGRVMMPRSRPMAFFTRLAFRALALYPPARDYVLQMKYKPKPFFQDGLLIGEAGPSLRGRMFPQPMVERRDGSKVLLDELLGAGLALVERDDGRSALSPPGERRPMDVAIVRVMPRDHRFLPGQAQNPECVRDLTGVIGEVFAKAGVRGVLLRPDRYVAAALPDASGPEELDNLVAGLVTKSKPGTADAPVPQRLDLARAEATMS